MAQPENDRQDQGKNRNRFGRWVLVVLLLIVVIVIGMLIPSVQRIRVGDGNRTACANNIRQIGLALQAANAVNNRLPPYFGTYNKKPNSGVGEKAPGVYPATIFYHLLPHLEEAGIYQRCRRCSIIRLRTNMCLSPNSPLVGIGKDDENAATFKVRTLICPSDITGDPSGVDKLSLIPGKMPESTWGANCYAANYLLFGMVKDAKLPESVPDGLSRTIIFTEKAPICADAASGRQGGNLWAVPAFFPSDPQARFNYASSIGYDPADANPTKPYSVRLFQIEPARGQCDPTLAQSPHDGGINVAMGDGSALHCQVRVAQNVVRVTDALPYRGDQFSKGW